MYNKQLKKNIKALDVKIGELYGDMINAKTEDERKQLMEQAIELADLRNKLSETKTRESLLPVVVPGLVGLTAIFMVIRHEDTNVITTKALGLASKFIRG